MRSKRKYKRESDNHEKLVYIPKHFRSSDLQKDVKKIYTFLYPYLWATISLLIASTIAFGLWMYHSDVTTWSTVNTEWQVHNLFVSLSLLLGDLLLQFMGVSAVWYAFVLFIWAVLLFLRRKITFLKTRLVFIMLSSVLISYLSAYIFNMNFIEYLELGHKFPSGAGGALGLLAFEYSQTFVARLPLPLTYLLYTALTSIALVLSTLSLGFTNKEVKRAVAFLTRNIMVGVFYLYIGVRFVLYAAYVLAARAFKYFRQRFFSAAEQENKPVQRNETLDFIEGDSVTETSDIIGIEQSESVNKGIVETFKEKALKPKQRKFFSAKGAYTPPSLSLLATPVTSAKNSGFSRKMLDENADKLMQVLNEFGVKGEILGVKPGPVVTLYELEPAAGVKSARIISLADDIARSMSARSARVSVVPGRNAMGIELPNENRETVYFKDVLSSTAYKQSGDKLPIGLGKDIGGAPVITDLAKMPHLLVAGTTGSGKSVGVNAMILSLLFKLSPEECKFIMIDPKMLELSVYDGIPHLLSPVVTEPKKAIVALKWVVQEMEARYRAMAQLGVRNIQGYNDKLKKALDNGEVLSRRVQTGFDSESGSPVFEDQPLDMTLFPYIVVVVDEMADLMLVAGKEIEAAVQRLAQMARAAGIHLIMATQRPSVDVITGTIKANFPTRIGFQVTSKIDSRTILGEQGAEQLLGRGDMLFMEPGGRVRRVHGAFVGDDEVERIVSELKQTQDPNYVDIYSISEDASSVYDDGMMSGAEGSGDELYDKAMNIILEEGKVSTSFIQRHLSIGYNRAAKIIERMEKEGAISAPNHVGKRDILVPHKKR